MKKLIIILLLICVAIMGVHLIYDKTVDGTVYNNTDVKSNDYLILVNRTHILNSDYTPANLIKPNVRFVSSSADEERMMQGNAAKALEELFKAAGKENINLYGVSAYRSYESQKQVYEQRIKKVGKKQADEYVAQPGTSEHQTGFAIDVTNEQGAENKLKIDFGETKEGKWLKSHAQDYGFIMRYPKEKENITGYNYESWHIRYVGVSIAKIIYSKQIVLEEYLKSR
ncbi:peptidase M15B and M15C DD-carboxypeptidase VanY/endolysin [Clostridium sp. DL-VIII]|uniref:M15 family metallopeptidase n=1 Tax=Clostridium sp. DL-VIII TaxID=641107 RepID=UPI00023B0767|nr:M15 family metallopeptidase [Clostridium sp. DL-VIII]EHJ01598.1 peptidase M15B and M15C DD-carboxypeptidase VanY/endolysin [Clostridium sp. DL-VIII]